MNFGDAELDLLSGPSGEAQPESGHEKFISFELGQLLCCVAAGAVAEVVHPAAVVALPNSPSWLLGLAAYRGEPVAVIDPATIARPSSENRTKAKVIVFRARPNEMRFALPIDSLQEMITAPAGETRPSPDRLYDGRPVTFLDHERLLESLESS